MYSLALLALTAFLHAPPQQNGSCGPVSSVILEQRLEEASSNPESRQGFIDSFVNSEIWVWITPQSLAEIKTHPEITSIQAVKAKLPSGEISILLFTRPQHAYAALGAEAALVAMSGEAALRLQTEIGVALNIGQNNSVRWSREEVETIVSAIRQVPDTRDSGCVRLLS